MGQRNLPHFVYNMKKITYLRKDLEKIFIEILKNCKDHRTQVLFAVRRPELVSIIEKIELKIDKIISDLDTENEK